MCTFAAAPYVYTNDTFKKMRNAMNEHFKENMADYDLVKLDCDTEKLWEMYLDGFPEEIKGIYRERAWHDCQACRRWFKRMGNIAALHYDGSIVTFFDYDVIPEYFDTFQKLRMYLHTLPISDVFYSSDKKIGFEKNFEQDEETGQVIQNDHFFTVLPNKFIKEGVKAGQEMSKARTNRELLGRTVDTFTENALETVLELIDANNLYRGKEWQSSIKKLLKIKQEVKEIDDDVKLNNYYWLESLRNGESVSRMKNLSMGVLLTDLSNGMSLEKAVKRYDDVTAPSNYKRPSGLFTKKMLENAKEKLIEMGYGNSLQRRFACIEDIHIKDTIFVNRNLTEGIKGNFDDVFSNLGKKAITVKQNFYNAVEISLEDFIKNELPKTSEVFLYTDDTLGGNFVSLIAPVDSEAPSMFKWDNAFCWAYRNNVADSMKQQVKAMGGDIDVDLRFSIRWNNDINSHDENDLDAHCVEPSGFVIYYYQKKSFLTDGWLDVDITDPKMGVPAVENIQYKDRKKMQDGDYLFRVNQYAYRGGDNGFEAEIEFDGKLYSFNYPHRIAQGKYVDVAYVTLKDGKFELTPKEVQPEKDNKTVWGVKMNDFIPVRLMCYSPNYWNNNVGHQHIFFMLQDCVTDDSPNAWYNEFLNNELNENGQVMEALGNEVSVEPTENQLSGMGFSLTKREDIIVKTIVSGEEKIFKIKI